MDVQTLAIRTGSPGRPRTRSQPLSPARAAPSDSGGGDAASIAKRRPWLLAYTAVSIIAGLTALAWTTLHVPINPAIDPNLGGTALAGPSGGMLLWIAYGMIGSLRVLPAPGGHSVWTFHFPFVAAAMSSAARPRERGSPSSPRSSVARLEEVPWYGTLALNSVRAFAAVVGGLTSEVLNGFLLTTSVSIGVADLVALAGGTIVLAAILIERDRGDRHPQGGPFRWNLRRDRDRVHRAAPLWARSSLPGCSRSRTRRSVGGRRWPWR